jgi:hypothetical protein
MSNVVRDFPPLVDGKSKEKAAGGNCPTGAKMTQ